MKLGSSLDFGWFELLRARVQNLASAPSSPAPGFIYFDTVDDEFKGWNGTAWVSFGASGGGSVVSVTSADGTITVDNTDPANPTIAVDTIDSSYVSDFDTQVRTSRLDQMAPPTASVDLNSQKLVSVQSGTAATDGVNKGQLDAATQGLTGVKDPARVIVTSNGTLATAFANGQSAGGVTLATGDRIVLAGQSSAAENGIYNVNASGAPTRASDADTSGEIKVGTYIYIQAGTFAGTQWVVSATGANPWVPGSSSSTWTFFFQATATQAGAGLTAPGGNSLAVGQGAGIRVGANDVAVDPEQIEFAAAFDVGDNVASSFVLTHNLGTLDVDVSLIEVATGDKWITDFNATSSNTATLSFAFVPTTDQFRAVVRGLQS